MGHNGRRTKPPQSLAALAHQQKKTLDDLVHSGPKPAAVEAIERVAETPLTPEEVLELQKRLVHALNEVTEPQLNESPRPRRSIFNQTHMLGGELIKQLLRIDDGNRKDFPDLPPLAPEGTTLAQRFTKTNISSAFDQWVAFYNDEADSLNAAETNIVDGSQIAQRYRAIGTQHEDAIAAIFDTAHAFMRERALHHTGAGAALPPPR